MPTYDLTQIDVPPVHTRFRTTQTKLPAPESLDIFEALRESESRSMRGQTICSPAPSPLDITPKNRYRMDIQPDDCPRSSALITTN
jgi:hypothetical protein